MYGSHIITELIIMPTLQMITLKFKVCLQNLHRFTSYQQVWKPTRDVLGWNKPAIKTFFSAEKPQAKDKVKPLNDVWFSLQILAGNFFMYISQYS